MGVGVIEKIYDVKILNSDKAYSEFDRINKLLLEIKKNVASMTVELANIFDTERARQYKQAIEDLKVKEKEMGVLKEQQAKQDIAAAKAKAIADVAASKTSTEAQLANERALTEASKQRAQQDVADAKIRVEAEREAALKIKTQFLYLSHNNETSYKVK